MKHTKNCPKCGGGEILKIPGMGPYGRNNGHISCGRTGLMYCWNAMCAPNAVILKNGSTPARCIC